MWAKVASNRGRVSLGHVVTLKVDTSGGAWVIRALLVTGVEETLDGTFATQGDANQAIVDLIVGVP